ncbi:hypothetical protein J1614_006188 [Plenodomus biglobosus]|nr:hypothetical protein J1614_006188 [Plenodomus biglobosus]
MFSAKYGMGSNNDDTRTEHRAKHVRRWRRVISGNDPRNLGPRHVTNGPTSLGPLHRSPSLPGATTAGKRSGLQPWNLQCGGVGGAVHQRRSESRVVLLRDPRPTTVGYLAFSATHQLAACMRRLPFKLTPQYSLSSTAHTHTFPSLASTTTTLATATGRHKLTSLLVAMFEHFALRHIPPLLLASIWTVGGTMAWTHGAEQAILTYGLSQRIASSETAWPLIRIEGSRVTTIGLAIWSIYLGGHLEAMDTLLACIGWMAVVDGLVCSKDGSPGSAKMRATYQGVVALWGLLGMTSGKYI